MEDRLTSMGTCIANNDPLLGGISQSKHVVWKWIRICIHHPVFYFNDNYSLRRETTRFNPHSHMQHGWRCVCVCKEKIRNWNVCLIQPLNNQKTCGKRAVQSIPNVQQDTKCSHEGDYFEKTSLEDVLPKAIRTSWDHFQTGLERYQLQPVDETILNSMASHWAQCPQRQHFWVSEESSGNNKNRQVDYFWIDRLVVLHPQRDE